MSGGKASRASRPSQATSCYGDDPPLCLSFGTTQALTVLLIYFGIALAILGLLDWRVTEPAA